MSGGTPQQNQPRYPAEEDDTILVTIRLLFKGNQVGTIIGRKGTKISQIREESACEVKIKGNERDIERIVSVSGSPSGVTRALCKIAEFVEGDLNDGLTGRTTKIPVTLNMIVPTGQCGSIIGKGGFRIKEIRENTGCNVKIANDLLPGSTEKLITLYGEPRVIEECVKAICQVMIEEGQERKCTPYIPATFGPSPVFGMDGMPRGATGYPPQGPPGPGGYPGYGPPHGAQAPPQQNYNQQNNWNGPHGPIHPVRHPFQGGFQQGFPQQNFPQDPSFILQDTSLDHFKIKLAMNRVQEGVVEVSVNKDMMGAVIGRGGSRISEIRMLSTQEIKIHEVEGESPVRRITIQGTNVDLDKAVLLLHVCVNVYTEPKEKVGHLQLLGAVQYAQTRMKAGMGKMDPSMDHSGQMGDNNGHVDPSRQMNTGYAGQPSPYQMEYYPSFPQQGQPRMPHYGAPGGRGGYNGHQNSKKRPLMEPTMEHCTDEEIPSNKREKFRQF